MNDPFPILRLVLASWFGFFASSVGLADAPERPLDVSDEVAAILSPLFSSILKANVTRATVELAAETVMNGVVVETEASTYQIASKHPGKYTIYYKAPELRRRLYANGKTLTVALANDAYAHLPEPLDCQQIVDELPLTIGPYPEPVLALTLAGVDPAITFLGGMRSIDVIERAKFRGLTDSVRLRGVQNDLVTWDLWISDEPAPRPLRLLVDLTPMLIATDQVAVPEGYGYSLRYDFTSWRITGDVDEVLFEYRPTPESTQYASVEKFEQSLAATIKDHPLLGQPAPPFELTLLDGRKVTSKQLEGKIVVLDFWSTWCKPCVEAMPTIEKMCRAYAKQGVVFVAVNVGEPPPLVKGFVSSQDWNVTLAVDPQAELANHLSAKSIPLTLILGRTGIVESAHIGFPGTEALEAQFRDEFDVLVQGGRIASTAADDETVAGADP